MKKIIVLILIPLILLLSYLLYKDNLSVDKNVTKNDKVECVINPKIVTINGYSMYPFLKPEEDVQAFFNYYDCHDILRNDVVLYKYTGNTNLLIKFIKAIPGDKWNLNKTDSGYEIVVNDVNLLNSEGKLYLISESSIKMLALYVKDYPIIPTDTYLLLGDKIDGSLDSTSFGLVSRKDIMARVQKK
jgi:signal peptidase I